MDTKCNTRTLVIIIVCVLYDMVDADLVVKLKNMYVENMNADLCIVKAGIKYYNRTSKIPKMSALFKKDMSRSKAHMVVYEWRNHEFRKFTPIEVSGSLNTLIDSKVFDIQNIFRNYWKPPLVAPIKSNVIGKKFLLGVNVIPPTVKSYINYGLQMYPCLHLKVIGEVIKIFDLVTYVQMDFALARWPGVMPEGQWKVKIHLYENDENMMASLIIEVNYVQMDFAFERWPGYMPEGQWKVKIHLYQKDDENLMASLVIEVETLKKYS